MFCYQCEQSQKGNCHTAIGVCGKDETTAAFQDILLYAAKGLSMYAHRLRQFGINSRKYDLFVIEALFTTVTNVNFDKETIKPMISAAYHYKEEAKAEYEKVCKREAIAPDKFENGPSAFVYSDDETEMLNFREKIGIENRMEEKGKVITGLEELVTYGLKGLAAYAEHAYILDSFDEEVFAKIHELMNFLTEDHSDGELLQASLETGNLNLRVMEILDEGHTRKYGHPVPVQVRITPVKGSAILVSGHDMKDLEELLKQTEGKGINIYTHGEMLPAHGYPELKKYSRLAGNYGGAWQDQHKEFDAFPGSILMTTNCIQKPRDSYKDRIFTCGLVRWPGVEHIENRDFSSVIETALNNDGFAENGEEKYIMTGFGHNAVLNVAGKVVDAVKAGQIKHFYLIGGCDGAKSGRNYYTEFAQKAPKDTVILTLACGKYRFNKMEFGDIGGIPRLLDIGQCNDAYSAIKIAQALSDAFGAEINALPLSMILSWYEQKAVAILLTLLYLGIKNIRLGPTLPKFLEPEVLQILVDNYNIMPLGTAEEDIAATLKAG